MWLMMLLAAGASALVHSGREHVGLSVTFEAPERPGAHAYVTVQFMPLDPAVHVNIDPVPRLRLGGAHDVLTDTPEPVPVQPKAEGLLGQYIDPRSPVRFAVALQPKPARGRHVVPASVTYFYCSASAGWCRRATDDVEVPVTLR